MPAGKPDRGYCSRRGDKAKVDKELLAKYPKAAPVPKGWALGPGGVPKTPPHRGGFEDPNPTASTYQYSPNACESGAARKISFRAAYSALEKVTCVSGAASGVIDG